MDESATGSVNFFGPDDGQPRWPAARPRRGPAPGYSLRMHLRMPSIDRGVQSFLWALVFFLILYFGMVAVDVHKGTALLVSLVSAFLIFLFVRTRGALAGPGLSICDCETSRLVTRRRASSGPIACVQPGAGRDAVLGRPE